MYENIWFDIRWIKLDQTGSNWIKHVLDKHGLDYHGLDKHGLDKYGLNSISKLPTDGIVLSKSMKTKMLAVFN
jgi:hypothetical protein